MAKQIPSRYDNFEFENANEEQAAKTFHPLNLMYLRKLRTDAITEKLAIKLDPEHFQDFIQNEAALVGRIELLNLLIGD